MKAIYRGDNAHYARLKDGETNPLTVGKTYNVTIEGDFYDVFSLDGERLYGWCGSTSLDDCAENWFFIQEPVEVNND